MSRARAVNEKERLPLSVHRAEDDADRAFLAQVRDAQLRRATMALPDRIAELTSVVSRLVVAVEALSREIATLQRGAP